MSEDDEDDGMDENGEYRFERSDPPVWWEGEALDYPMQRTLHEWFDDRGRYP
jgi:hypothetical protein